MLYIFHVDTGRMLTFDMNLALETVQTLKENIEKLHGLPVSNQVLLISGGDILQPSSRVCSYSSGTDTNPIFMFITSFVDSKIAPQPWPSIEPDTDFEKQVQKSLALPATYNTVVARAQLAQQFYEAAREEIKICDKLVYEQHLQQQGWAAVIANLEDLTNELRHRYEDFCRCFDEFSEKKEYYSKLLESFDQDLAKLSIIPILSGLISSAQQEFHGFDEFLYDNESFVTSMLHGKENIQKIKTNAKTEICDEAVSSTSNINQQKLKTLTLLQWVSAKETHKSFEHVAVNCLKQLQSFENDKMLSLRNQIQKTIESAEKEDVREIKGLKDRLQGLDKLMVEVKNKVQDQSELAIAFQQNQNRASNLGDASILPDLCETHSSQLSVMHKNHIGLRDIRRRISKAKEELGSNVMQRLKFIGHIENRMSELDNQMLFSHRCLRRFQRHLVIIEQIHFAPIVYVTAVTEVVRRRTFSNLFLKWASELACHLQAIHDEEVLRRREFESLFEGHFLNGLFSGMEDMPPTYAIQAPAVFDSFLPNLTKDDLDILANSLPDVSSKIAFPDLTNAINFFLFKHKNNESITKDLHSEEKSVYIDSNVLKVIDFHTHLKDEFESETDTEEFEKVGQSPIERRQYSSLANQQSFQSTTSTAKPELKNIATSTESVEMQSIETLTEDNFSTVLEVEKLKNLLQNMHKICNSSIILLRTQLSDIKTDSNSNKILVNSSFEKIDEVWHKMKNEMQINERETVNRLTVDHELEMNDIKKYLNVKNDENEYLKIDKKNLEECISKLMTQREQDLEKFQDIELKLRNKISDLEQQIEKSTSERDKIIDDLKENLTREQKTEFELLRCRYKLMTNMERSPSDTSLEKIERLDVIDLTSHQSILLQTREDLEYERDIAVKEAVDMERMKWEKLISASPKSLEINAEIYKNILDEKDHQLDMIRDRERMLTEENCRYQETIQKLTDPDGSEISILRIQFDKLQDDKCKLEQELNLEKSRRMEMENSLIAEKSTLSASMSSTTNTGSRPKTHSSRSRVILEGCAEGDIVAIVWNPDHGQYIIVQDSQILFFLHELSHKKLNLVYPSGNDFVPTKLHCIGRIVAKEYCEAKKDDNRYKVSLGTKFYRIRAEPISSTAKSVDTGKRLTKRERQNVERSISKPQSSHLLIDSFAQTDNSRVVDKDMVDSGVVTQKSTYKERNISITEEDEPAIYHHEHFRYIGVEEGDESSAETQLK